MANEEKKISKKKLNKRRFTIDVFFVAFWVFAILVATFYCHLPIFNSPISNNILIVVVNTIITAMIGYTIWDYRKEYSLFNKILHYISIITVWLPLIITSHKAVMMIDILVGLTVFCYLTFVLSNYSFRILPYAMYFFILRGIAPNLLGYFDIAANSSRAYLVISVIISIMLTVFAIGAIDHMRAKKLSIVWGIILFAVLLFLVFTIVTAIINSANYALDFSQPERITATIIDAEEDKVLTGKSSFRIDYYILAEINGEETKIQTTRMVYNQTDIGDEITVLVYDGALSIPYYTIEPIE